MKLNKLSIAALSLAAGLVYTSTSQAATIVANLQAPPEASGGQGYWYGAINVYRWDDVYEWWDWQGSASTYEYYNDSETLAVTDLPEGTYYIESNIEAYDGDGFYAYDNEYYNDTKDFSDITEISLLEDEVYDVGDVDFDITFPKFAVTSVNFVKKSNYIPSEGGKATFKVRIKNRTDEDLPLLIWGIHEHYDSNYNNYIQNPVTKKSLTKTLPAGAGDETVYKFTYSVPEELPNDSTSVRIYAGTSYFSTDIQSNYGYLYKGDDYYYRASSSQDSTSQLKATKHRVAKIVDKDGKVLKYK